MYLNGALATEGASTHGTLISAERRSKCFSSWRVMSMVKPGDLFRYPTLARTKKLGSHVRGTMLVVVSVNRFVVEVVWFYHGEPARIRSQSLDFIKDHCEKISGV